MKNLGTRVKDLELLLRSLESAIQLLDNREARLAMRLTSAELALIRLGRRLDKLPKVKPPATAVEHDKACYPNCNHIPT